MTEFHALYQRYAPQVRRLALFLSGDPALADDIAAETFVRAWTAPGPLRQETLKAYLFTIVRNLYQDSLRQARRHTPIEDSVPDGRVGLERQAEARSELQFVLAWMQELPELDRAALLMRAQEGMSYEEISEALGLSVTALKVRIHRARLKLMQLTKKRKGSGGSETL